MREAQQRRAEWLSGGLVTREQLAELHAKARGCCFYCGCAVAARFTPGDPRGFDHVTPRARGGKHEIENMVVCCGSCNAKKSG
ncbi:MAG: HNH endonuclease [Planctomycetes bacterium]|nr:HNH endonuclease [Planctomycetota bacterium]